LLLPALLAAEPATVAAMRDRRRVLLVSASDATDPRLDAQRRILRRWGAEADDRDLTVVEIVGDRVAGAADAAADLRRRYRLPATGYAVALIGKDGGTKLRGREPLSAERLTATIDAMPMRRAGGR